MATSTKPVGVEEDRLSSIESRIADADQAQATAQEVYDNIAGLNVLGESSPAELTAAADALSDAQRNLSALRSAKALLEGRQREQDGHNEQERIGRLRAESQSAQAAQTKAMAMVAKAAGTLSDSLEVVKAQAAVLDGLHAALALADPIAANEVQEDHRGHLAAIQRSMDQKRAAVRQTAASAQYRLQAPSEGTDPTVEQEIPLPLGGEVIIGTRYSVARAAVLDAEVAALLALEDQERKARSAAWDEMAANTEKSGLGGLPATPSEVREAAALDAEAVAVMIPESLSRSLAGLADYLPRSPWEGISVRAIRPKDAVTARMADQRLDAGKKALALLAHI